jgi:hypothetical protein
MTRCCTLLIALLSISLGTAQTPITGTIQDQAGTPLTGANLFLEGTYDGGSADAQGRFSFSTSENGEQILVASMLGFEEYRIGIKCNGQPLKFAIVLKEAFDQLKAVEISAGAMEASDEKRSVVFKPLDVVTTAGALGDIVGALNTLPGTSVNTNDGRLLVRGGSAEETAIFFDGLKVNNAYGSSISGIPTRTRFSPQLFKGTFFSTGGYSAEYGQALSSVLALNTLDMPLRDQTDISVMSVGGAISHTEVLNEDAFTINGSYTNLAPYMSLVPQNLSWKTNPESYNLEGLYRHSIGKRSLLKLYYTHQGSKMLVLQPKPGSEDLSLRGVKNRFNYANASIRHAFNNDWLIKGGASFSHNLDHFTVDSLKPQREESLIHLKARVTWFATNRLQFHAGLEHFQQFFEESLDNNERGISLPLSATHLESQYFFTERITLKAGLRAEVQQHSAKVMPRISAAYRIDNKQQVSAAFGDFHQNQPLPTLLDNPHLDQSRSKHLLLNYQWAHKGITFRTEIFQKSYQNLLHEAIPEASVNTEGFGFARGFDLFYRDQKNIKNLDYWITYSFIDSKRKYSSYSDLVQPGFAPQHNLSVVAKYWVSQLNSQVGMSWQFNDGFTYDNPNLSGEMESKTKPYSGMNLNWSYLPKPNLIIHVAVNNVFGRENIFGYQYANQPNENGVYPSLAVQSPADRFFFIGVFITLSEDKKANQLNNL